MVGTHNSLFRSPTFRVLCLSIAGWSIFGLISYGQDISRRMFVDDPQPWQEWKYWTIRILISAALTPFVLYLGRRWPLDKHTWTRSLPTQFVFSLGFALLRTAIEAAIFLPLRAAGHMEIPPLWIQSPVDVAKALMIFGIPNALIGYWVVLSIQATFGYYEKLQERELTAAELRGQVARARLETLKVQLQPHFLFNTLNAIVVLVREQRATEAEEALAHLSDLLRAVLDDTDAHEVTLARDIEYLKLYLAIQQMRFSDRLQVRFDVDGDAEDAAVLHMGLQPLVENAIRHGIAKRAAGGMIHIEARREGQQLCVYVTNDGPGFPPAKISSGWGRGLSNTSARLQQLYGKAAELRVLATAGKPTTVVMIVPFRRHRSSEVQKIATGGLAHVDDTELGCI